MESEPGSSFLFEHDLSRLAVALAALSRWRSGSENRFPPRIKSGAGFFGIMR
jgi:hypothetical protein